MHNYPPWIRRPGDPPADAQITVERVDVLPPHDGGAGQGLLLRTNLGDIKGILHRAGDSDQAVIWVCGALGGFEGPGAGTYARLSEEFRSQGITSLRLDYREPNALTGCVMDLLAGVCYLKDEGCGPVVIVGHSFGGAVVIAAGAHSPHVKGVVSLAPQTFGADRARQLSPRPLLVVHGKSDTRLPYTFAIQIYNLALQPKELVLYDRAEHRLQECQEELEQLLKDWIPAALATPLGI